MEAGTRIANPTAALLLLQASVAPRTESLFLPVEWDSHQVSVHSSECHPERCCSSALAADVRVNEWSPSPHLDEAVTTLE